MVPPLPMNPEATSAAAPASAVHLSAALPLRRDDTSEEPARAVLAWSVVLLAIAAGVAYVFLRRSGRLAKGGSMWGGQADLALRRGAGLPLSTHASVQVVQWGSDEYLLGCTPQQVTLLARRPLQPPADAQGSELAR